MPDHERRERIHAAVIRLLREERDRQGVSMYQLAPKAGLSQSALSLIERGLRMPALDTLLRIAEVLEVRLGDILLKAEAEGVAIPKASKKKAGTK
jgi:transcriptional regulator with XRE-family HTH domain